MQGAAAAAETGESVNLDEAAPAVLVSPLALPVCACVSVRAPPPPMSFSSKLVPVSSSCSCSSFPSCRFSQSLQRGPHLVKVVAACSLTCTVPRNGSSRH